MIVGMKKGLISSSLEKVAHGTIRAADARKGDVYLPGFWRLIMFIIRNVPGFIFHKTKL
jgi:hypothetical protein